MAIAAAPTDPGMGAYWRLPEEERSAFRRRLRVAWQLPENRTPTERQMLLILASYNRSLKEPIFYGGAMGGAKSAGLCMLAIHLCRTIPNNRVLLCRKTFASLRGSTLTELEEQLESCPDAKHWPGKRQVDFARTGSQIVYMGVGEPGQKEKLGSYQFGAVLPDEATEIEHDVIRMLQTRMRLRSASKAKRIVLVMAGNPYPGWIRQDFIKAPKRGYTFIPSRAADNPHLPSNYAIDMKSEMPESWYRAFILGDWDAMDMPEAAIPPQLVSEGRKRSEVANDNDCVWGIDVGHLGVDSTWICRRRGFVWDYVKGWDQTRIPETVNRVVNLLSVTDVYPRRLVIDNDGLGAGVTDGLMVAQDEGLIPMTCEIVGLSAQKTATVETPGFASIKYANIKAQNAFELRRILQGNRGHLPDDEEMEEDLTSANYEIIDGRVYIETKKLVKKKLGRSPDKGDAMLLTCYVGGRDEMAGLPANADQLIARARTEEDEMVTLEQEHRLRQWYANPFGFGRTVDVIDVDSDLGY